MARPLLSLGILKQQWLLSIAAAENQTLALESEGRPASTGSFTTCMNTDVHYTF